MGGDFGAQLIDEFLHDATEFAHLGFEGRHALLKFQDRNVGLDAQGFSPLRPIM